MSSSSFESEISFPVPGYAETKEKEEDITLPPTTRKYVTFQDEPTEHQDDETDIDTTTSTKKSNLIPNEQKGTAKARKGGLHILRKRKSWRRGNTGFLHPNGVSFVDQADSSKDIEKNCITTWSAKSEGTVIRRGRGMISKAKTLEPKYWIAYFSWSFLALFIQFLVGTGEWAFPQGGSSGSEDNMPACSPAEEMSQEIRNKNVCELNETLQGGSRSLSLLSAFIVGGFLANSVNLWLTRRTAYCALCGSTRNLLINLCTIVQSEHERVVLTRWAVLGFELAVLKGRGLIDLAEGRTYLEDLRLIKSNEWDTMVHGDRHTTVWYWIQTKAGNLSRDGVIDSICFQTICNAVTLSRDKANDLMSCIDRDQPPPYVFVCACLININLFLHSTATGLKWAIWMYDSGLSIWLEPRMYVELLILFLYTAIYGMLFDVCTIMYNPFGPRDIDIEHFKVGSGIRHLAKQLQKPVHPDTMDCFARGIDLSKTSSQNNFADDMAEKDRDIVDRHNQANMEMALLSSVRKNSASSHRNLLGFSMVRKMG